MKERNVEGSSRGYMERVISSYSAVTPLDVRKFFLSTLKFCGLYMQGETGLTVNRKMQELRKIKKCHRGAARLDSDTSKKVYSRQRLYEE